MSASAGGDRDGGARHRGGAHHGAVRAVSFDAGGTLIAPVEPVGATYARLARAAGLDADAAALDDGFRRAFAAAPPLAPPPGATEPLLAFEHAWWRAIVADSLAHAHGAPLPAARAGDFERFFAATYAHYARRDAWRLLPDAAEVVAELRQRGVALALLSNFDQRLHALVAAFDLAPAFRAVVPSTEAGAAKPARAAFEHVRQRLGGLAPSACLHVGDSLREDVSGALDAGWQAVWLDRDGDVSAPLPAGATRITRLAALLEHLG